MRHKTVTFSVLGKHVYNLDYVQEEHFIPSDIFLEIASRLTRR